MIKKYYKYCFFAFIFLFISLIFLWFAHCKAGFFIDEIYTYGLSNSHYAPYISDAAGGSLVDTEISRETLLDYVTVGQDEISDFGSVYYNQEQDVHPPLYYWLFHIASSFAGQTFTKWTGLILNYFLYLIALFLLCLLAEELYQNHFVTAAVLILYGASTIGISTAIYLRMYVLLAVFTILLAWLVLCFLKSESNKHLPLIGLAIFAGMLTQYYFVFYAFFLCAAVVLYLLAKKEWKKAGLFALSAILGVACMVAVFPASLKHIFVGNGTANGSVVGGSHILDTVSDTSQYLSHLNSFLHFITYGLKGAVFMGGFFALLAVALCIHRRCFPKERPATVQSLLLIFPAVLAWLIVAIISPVAEERYIYNLMPIFSLVPGYFLWLIAQGSLPLEEGSGQISFLTAKKGLFGWWAEYLSSKAFQSGVLVLSGVLCLLCILQNHPQNLFPQYLKYDAIIAEHADDPCVYLTDEFNAPLTFDLEQLLTFDSVFTTNNTSSSAMLDYIASNDSDGELVIYIDESTDWSSGYDPDILLPELESSTGYIHCEELYTDGFSGTYLLTK